MRFTQATLNFGPPPPEHEDDGTGLPLPTRVQLAARNFMAIKEAGQVLEHLPQPNESLHAVCTHRLDLTDLINALIERKGKIDRLLVATLGYNKKNLAQLLGWLDDEQVGSMSLVASKFFRSHNGGLWGQTRDAFARRKQRCACCYSHAKVAALYFADGGRMSLEGSANLCSNGSGREQVALINHDGLTEWHSAWITALLDRHEDKEETDG